MDKIGPADITLAKIDDKMENFTNDDIFHYLVKFKDEVAKDNNKLESKVNGTENKTEEKLERMKLEIENTQKEHKDIIDNIGK